MESEIPNLFLLLSGTIFKNPEHFFSEDVRVGLETEDEIKEILFENVKQLAEHYALVDYKSPTGVTTTSVVYPKHLVWDSRKVLEILLAQLYRLAHKGNVETPETLVVLDRPIDPDAALGLMIDLHRLAEQLNELPCFIKIRFVLLGNNMFHQI